MGAVKTYDPKSIIVIYGGVPIAGFADGTFVSVSPAGDRFGKGVGADGEVSRNKSNDNTSEVTLTLMQTSISNDYLSGVLNLDKLSNAGKLPLMIKDMLGTTLLAWSEAWIKTPPTVDMSKETGERAWVLDTGQIDIENFGGNF